VVGFSARFAATFCISFIIDIRSIAPDNELRRIPDPGNDGEDDKLCFRDLREDVSYIGDPGGDFVWGDTGELGEVGDFGDFDSSRWFWVDEIRFSFEEDFVRPGDPRVREDVAHAFLACRFDVLNIGKSYWLTVSISSLNNGLLGGKDNPPFASNRIAGVDFALRNVGDVLLPLTLALDCPRCIRSALVFVVLACLFLFVICSDFIVSHLLYLKNGFLK